MALLARRPRFQQPSLHRRGERVVGVGLGAGPPLRLLGPQPVPLDAALDVLRPPLDLQCDEPPRRGGTFSAAQVSSSSFALHSRASTSCASSACCMRSISAIALSAFCSLTACRTATAASSRRPSHAS